MDFKWIGAVLIISGCGGFGFSVGSAHRREERCLRSLLRVLEYMTCELQFRATPLPELCRGAAKDCGRELAGLFSRLAEQLELCSSSDAATSMEAALNVTPGLPLSAARNLKFLGGSLGRFDLSGQLKALEEARNQCRSDLDALTAGRDERLRNYQTLSLCAGAALAILLI